MIVSFKALYRNVPEALDIVDDVLLSADLTNEERMKDLIAERKNNLQSALIPSGHLFAKIAAGAALTIPGYRDEQWHGCTQLKIVQTIARDFTIIKDDFCAKIDELRKMIFCKNNLTINMTADAEGLHTIQNNVHRLIDRMPMKSMCKNETKSDLKPVCTGIAVPSQVSYVAYVLKTPAYTDPISPLLMLTSKDLSNNYLYKHIRVRGGAYGGMSSFDTALGLFSFLSYRDPHIVQTIETFQKASEYYRNQEISADDLEKPLSVR